jgi:hypothetical protein
MASSVGGDHRRRGQRRLGRPANFLRALGLALGSAVIDLDLGTGSPTLVLASVFDDELRPGAAPAESLRGHRGVGAARGLTVLTTRTVPAGEAGHPHHFSVGYSRLAGQRSGPHTCRWFLLARAVASTETIGIGQARKARCRAPGTAGGGGSRSEELDRGTRSSRDGRHTGRGQSSGELARGPRNLQRAQLVCGLAKRRLDRISLTLSAAELRNF